MLTGAIEIYYDMVIAKRDSENEEKGEEKEKRDGGKGSEAGRAVPSCHLAPWLVPN